MSSVEPVTEKPRTLQARPDWKPDDTARQFLPAALEILETPASPVGRMVAATIILFFAIAIAWAILGHVDIIATASGKIVPTGRTKTIQPLETGIVSVIHVQDGDRVAAGQVLIELDRTVTQAERKHVAQDLVASQLDVARLVALRDGFSGTMPADLTPPAGAMEADITRARSSMKAQASEQLAKVASINRQIEQKAAEFQSITATIAKIDASLPLVEESATIRRKAMEIQYGNHIAYLEAQTKLVEQRNERMVQQRKLAEVEAARQALEQQVEQTRAGYERQVLSDLSDAQKKVIDGHCTPEWASKVTDPWTDFEANGRVKMKALEGHEVYALTAEQLGEWKKAVKPLHDSWAEAVKKAGGDAAAVDAALQATLKKFEAGI